MKKYLILILSLVLAVTVLTACGGNSSKSGNEVKDTFIVGFDKEFPPMGYVADDGSFVGFDLDLAKEVADRLGYTLKLQPISWSAKDMELESGNVDVVWNGFTITEARKSEYTWTQPYMENNQVVVVLKNSDITTLADVAGKSVAVQDDSSALTAIEGNVALKDSIGNLVKTQTNLNALMELESGAVDAVVMDEIVARFNIEKKGANYKVLDESVGAEVFGVGFKLGNTELRDKVEATLLEMAADGKLAEISESWFGKDITIIGK
ncbi:ABC transporter substrate-binding protein [Desulfuribacillus stibiiarsenatis]|uniref:ABC transporter substrate-binding protein n=1 Tax=Desulfuribacillus stibiiarsenatis TaxID=1390249 RepID=A0A1E5L4X3_9FIRM|nr:amino acid ABC transporter substrate-binding protein [Desulfuribacillus stibiiarsenatis]OEH85160.1 ABC transporter substrate-binding protein [Desulfuribacillus stibiiarsenatis]